VVVVVLVLLTGPLAYLPEAALAAVVFLIAAGLIDVAGMRRILATRRRESVIALLTAAAVVVLGVEYGLVIAVIASIIDHLRHSYSPLNSVLVKSPAGHWRPIPVAPGARTEQGLVIYRFGTSLYFANTAKLVDDTMTLTSHGGPVRWFVIDCAAIEDVDYTASVVLARLTEQLQQRHVRLVLSTVLGPVQRQLDRYGIGAALGPGCYYGTPTEALQAFHAAQPADGPTAQGGQGALRRHTGRGRGRRLPRPG
jgi:SulP family sulfate permease